MGKHSTSNILMLLMVFISGNLAKGQTFMDVRQYGSAAQEVGYAICTAPGGSVVMAGFYPDSVNFGGIVMHATGFDGFVVKYNANGTVAWARRITGAGAERCYAVKADNAGNIYVAGEFYNTATLDTFSITSLGGNDIFLAKFSSSGTPLWFKRYGSTLSDDRAGGIALDGNANIYMCGEYSGNAQFGNGVSLVSVNHPTMGPSIDVFTAKFNTNGIAQWAVSGGSIGTDRGYDIDCDNAGNSYITGFYQNNASFGGAQLTQGGPVQLFAASYSTTGSMQMILQAGSAGYESGYGIELDGLGNFYITGLHDDFTVFDTITAIPSGSYDMFLAKYSISGDVQWVRSTVSSQWEQGWTVDCDDKGNPYVGAYIYHSGTSMFTEANINSIGYYDVVVVKYNRHGEFQWATRGGTINYDEVLEIAVADSGIVYGAGYFGGNLGFSHTGTFGAFTFQTFGNNDVLFFKMRTDITTGQVNFNTFCAGQAVTVPFKVHTISMAPGNIYTAQLSDKDGRFANAVNIGTLASNALTGVINGLIPDSMVEGSGYRIRVISSDSARVGGDNGTNITIHSLPPATITSAGTDFCSGDTLLLTAPAGPGLTYQWLNAFVPIQGAMSQNYNVLATGVYNVIVSNQFGCNRTSSSLSATKRSLPSAAISAQGSTTICAGKSVTLAANTGPGLTYQWKRNVNFEPGAIDSVYSATKNGNYKCIVSNLYGCTRASNKIVVTVLALPSASITAQGATTFCAGDSVVLQANTGAGLTHQWKKYANVIVGATASSYAAKVTGNYKVVVTNANGCSKTSNSILVTVNCRLAAPGEIPVDTELQLAVAPNPVQDILAIQINSTGIPVRFVVSDALGRVVMEFESNPSEGLQTIETDASFLKPGLYFLTADLGGKVKSVRFAKE